MAKMPEQFIEQEALLPLCDAVDAAMEHVLCFLPNASYTAALKCALNDERIIEMRQGLLVKYGALFES